MILCVCSNLGVICNQQWISNAHIISYCTEKPDSASTKRMLKKEKYNGLGYNSLQFYLDFSSSYFPIWKRTFCFSWHLNLYFNFYGEILAECLLTGLVEVPYMKINGITASERSKTTTKMLKPNKTQSADVFLLSFTTVLL